MNYDPAEILAAQEHFGFARPTAIEKDWHILRAMGAIASTDAAPFKFVFAGGTSLARAHKIVQRMSEDVDFKITPLAADSISLNQRRKQLGSLRDRVTASLRAFGFSIDPADSAQLRSRDGNRYIIYQLSYANPNETAAHLRPTIQVELNYSALRRPWIDLPVASFVAEAFNRSPEITSIACVSVAETAAEKLVSLTRRTAMELAGVARVRDPTLVRHIYDLHVTSAYYDATEVAQLAREIMPRDAEEFANQFPAYRENPVEETRRALAALETEQHFAQRYTEFLQLMVYGVKPDFAEAMATIASLVGRL